MTTMQQPDLDPHFLDHIHRLDRLEHHDPHSVLGLHFR